MIHDSRVGLLDIKALSIKAELSSEEKDKFIAYMKPLMIDPTGRNIINRDNYEFSFNKLLEWKNFKRQNDVLPKVVKANWLKFASNFIGIISTGIMMYKYMSPDTKMRTAGLVAAGTSTMLNRTNTLVNGPSYGYDNVNDWL